MVAPVTPQDQELINLLRIAKIARKDIEALNLSLGDRMKMTGYCGIGSRWLQSLAASNGIKVDFVVGRFVSGRYNSQHCWIEYRGIIIDITASQFNLFPIHLCSSTDVRYRHRAENKLAFTLMKNWPETQRYHKFHWRLRSIHYQQERIY